jgi:hypothetical protein
LVEGTGVDVDVTVCVGAMVEVSIAVAAGATVAQAVSINITKAMTQKTFFILPPEGVSTLYYITSDSAIMNLSKGRLK